MEAIQKLSNVENALCNTEDECSLLRDQLVKTQGQTQETTQRLDVMLNQLDDKVTDHEENIFKKETELKSLNSELNELQDKLGNYKVNFGFFHLVLLNIILNQLPWNYQQQNEIGDYENSSLVANWLLKSDIKNIDGSEDIIKAICAEEVSFILRAILKQYLTNILKFAAGWREQSS